MLITNGHPNVYITTSYYMERLRLPDYIMERYEEKFINKIDCKLVKSMLNWNYDQFIQWFEDNK